MKLEINSHKKIAATLCLLATLLSLAVRAETSPRFAAPPQPIVDMIETQASPQPIVSPNQQHLLFIERAGLPSISDLALPQVRVAGLRINPRNNDISRVSYGATLKLLRLSDKPADKAPEKYVIQGIPAGGLIGEALWSPDSKRIAISVTRETALELWIVDVASAHAKRLTDRNLNGVSGRAFAWLADSRSLVALLVPQNRGAVPAVPVTPIGPNVQETSGKIAAARTFPDLLKNSYDEQLLEYYMQAQPAKIALDGVITPVGKIGIIRAIAASPDANFLLVQAITKPYSRVVPIGQFAIKTELRDLSGSDTGEFIKALSTNSVVEDDDGEPDAVRRGPRAYAWRADAPATLTWVQSNEADKPIKKRDGDYLYALGAPFQAEPNLILKLDFRFVQVVWGTDDVALVYEGQRKTRRSIVWRIFPGDLNKAAIKLFDRSSEDRYGDPGTPLFETSATGQRVLNMTPNKRAIYLSGNGASADGDRPFLDVFNFDTKQSARLFQSEPPAYESVAAVFDNGTIRLLTQRESQTETPNLFLRNVESKTITPITNFATPKNPIAGVSKELIRYKRRDGTELSGTLYLPANYKRGDGPLPTILWAYPREFKTTEAAGQVTGSPYRYVRPSASGPLPWLTQGYAVLDNPVMPIIGEGNTEPNDSYIPQLIASAEAAIDELVRRGVTDKNRVAVGGHSYGAFMVANLLAHSKLFAAGIAESGAYNRTLTPFGFQAETRNMWKARDVYNQMSPFNFADQIKAPLLFIHGENDSNPGTFPVQSERMYQAIRGLGGTARLVLLPFEDHAYRARESQMHRAAEITNWLDKFVKTATPTNKLAAVFGW
jgi:dipeptidyl aminopeptidase/acylaminoacyl peptidase